MPHLFSLFFLGATFYYYFLSKLITFYFAPLWFLLAFQLNSWVFNFFFLLIIIYTLSPAFSRLFFMWPVAVLHLWYFFFSWQMRRVVAVPDTLYTGFINFHPPLFYLSFLGFFYLTLSNFLCTRSTWLNCYKLFFIFTFISVVALFSGGYWSYLETTWGFWWSWDLIELILLAVCFTLTACYHTLLIFLFWRLVFTTALFLVLLVVLVRLGFFRTRHSFFIPNLEQPLSVQIYIPLLFFWVRLGFVICLALLYATVMFLLKTIPTYYVSLTLLFLFIIFLYLFLKKTPTTVYYIHVFIFFFVFFLYNPYTPVYNLITTPTPLNFSKPSYNGMSVAADHTLINNSNLYRQPHFGGWSSHPIYYVEDLTNGFSTFLLVDDSSVAVRQPPLNFLSCRLSKQSQSKAQPGSSFRLYSKVYNYLFFMSSILFDVSSSLVYSTLYCLLLLVSI